MTQQAYNQSSYMQTVSPSVYRHLSILYNSNDFDIIEKSLNALPESFRRQIFSGIQQQKRKLLRNSPSEDRVFDSRVQLQTAVLRVAIKAFRFLEGEQKNVIKEMQKSYLHHASSFGKNHTVDRDIFLKAMQDSLGDLTPQLQRTLDAWVEKAGPGEGRDCARSQIIDFLKDTQQKELALSSLDLRELPAIFNQYPFISRLEVFDVSSNQLTAIPKEIGKLRSLTSLVLDSNQLTAIPEEIGKLSHLNTLEINHNKLTEIPEEICELHHLKILEIKHNKLTEIPEEICELRHLEYLDLSHNQITEIPEEIRELKNYNLARLNLSHNQITEISEGICKLHHLEYLDFSHNQLVTITGKIGKLYNLALLDLHNNPTLKRLPDSLFELSKDCSLDLARTGIPENTVHQ